MRCQEHFEKHTGLSCGVDWAFIQGFEAHVRQQRKVNWDAVNLPEDCKPMAFDEHGRALPRFMFLGRYEDSLWSGRVWTTRVRKRDWPRKQLERENVAVSHSVEKSGGHRLPRGVLSELCEASLGQDRGIAYGQGNFIQTSDEPPRKSSMAKEGKNKDRPSVFF